jgi:excisionase family DNA binding protein
VILGRLCYSSRVSDAEGLTAPEVAERLKVKPSTVLRWLREGKLRGVRLGGSRAGWRVTAAEVQRVLNEGISAKD